MEQATRTSGKALPTLKDIWVKFAVTTLCPLFQHTGYIFTPLPTAAEQQTASYPSAAITDRQLHQ